MDLIKRWWTNRRGLLEGLVLKVLTKSSSPQGWIDESTLLDRVKTANSEASQPVLIVSGLEIGLALDRLVKRGAISCSFLSPQDDDGTVSFVYALSSQE